MRRVVFDPTFGGFVGEFRLTPIQVGLKPNSFGFIRLLARAVVCKARRFSRVLQQFPGYCCSLEDFLQSTGATVLDWQTDFIAGR